MQTSRDKPIVTALVIESRVDMRAVIKETLREMDIQILSDAATTKEAWGALEQLGAPDWIITGYDDTAKHNSIALLALTLTEQQFLNTRVSWLITAEEALRLPMGYALGLLSHHLKPCTKSQLKAQWTQLFTELKAPQAADALVAASYLRTHLTDAEKYTELTALERCLIRSHPESSLLHARLAEAQFLAGQNEAALTTLAFAEHLGPEVKIASKQLRDMFQPPGSAAKEPTSLGTQIKHCLIVETDDVAAAQVEKILRKLGIGDIAIASHGQMALDIASTITPDLIIQEWKLPGISGPGLLQRWRQQKNTQGVAIVVASSLVEKDDKPLLREMGVLFAISKPLDGEAFATSLVTALHLDNAGNVKQLEQRFRLALIAEDRAQVDQIGAAIIASIHTGTGLKRLIEAEIAFLDGRFPEARDLAAAACRGDADPVVAINLLGRALLKTKDAVGAKRCFERARQLSPKNIERICALAAAHCEAGTATEATELLKTARAVDSGSSLVQQAEVIVALSGGPTGSAAQLAKDPGVLQGVLSYLNNRAVSLAQSGEFDAGIKLYREAEKIVPVTAKDIRASIALNLGLALARRGDLPAAAAELNKASSLGNSRLGDKLRSLTKRIEHAIATGTPVHWAVHKKDDNYAPVLVTHRTCLHGIFETNDVEEQSEMQQALADRPRFKAFEQTTLVRAAR